MRAVTVEEIGLPPVVRDVPDPVRGEGEALVEVKAASLNPIDLSIAAGRFYSKATELPYIAGREGVGRVLESDAIPPGSRVYFPMPGGLGGPGGRPTWAASAAPRRA